MKHDKVKILDTTLRDGSYVVDFQFTARDTALIASRLDHAGIDFIEIGHGLGLGAGTKKGMVQPEPDEAYLEAGRSAVKKGMWGMFFIPGIGTLADIKMAAKLGMSFIRIGTNVTEVRDSEQYVRLAKELGMYVFANYMKTYAVSPEIVAEQALISESYGTDIVCIVDSAGGMFEKDISNYFNAVQKRTKIPLGFHGHNNLGMANSNALRASELGAAVIDTSLRGMGRSSGNTVTEIFLLSLKRQGIDLGIDINGLFDTAEVFIDPLLKKYNQVDSIGIVSGFAQFHSSFLSKVMKYASEYNVDPRELIVQLTNKDKINAPDQLLVSICEAIQSQKKQSKSEKDWRLPNPLEARPANLNLDEKAGNLASRVKSMSGKWASTSVFNLVQGLREKTSSSVSDAINEDTQFMIASAEVYSASDAKQISEAIDGKVDFVLLDCDIKTEVSQSIVSAVKTNISASIVLQYSDLDVWVRAATRLAIQLAGTIHGTSIRVVGNSFLTDRLTYSLSSMGALLEENENPKILIFSGPTTYTPTGKEDKNLIVIDAWVGSLPPKTVDFFRSIEAAMYRVEMHGAIQSETLAAVKTHQIFSKNAGLKEQNGVKFGAGGVLAPLGTVIVDSLNRPSRIIGIADGSGHLIPAIKYTETHRLSLIEVEKIILVTAVDPARYAN